MYLKTSLCQPSVLRKQSYIYIYRRKLEVHSSIFFAEGTIQKDSYLFIFFQREKPASIMSSNSNGQKHVVESDWLNPRIDFHEQRGLEEQQVSLQLILSTLFSNYNI